MAASITRKAVLSHPAFRLPSVQPFLEHPLLLATSPLLPAVHLIHTDLSSAVLARLTALLLAALEKHMNQLPRSPVRMPAMLTPRSALLSTVPNRALWRVQAAGSLLPSRQPTRASARCTPTRPALLGRRRAVSRASPQRQRSESRTSCKCPHCRRGNNKQEQAHDSDLKALPQNSNDLKIALPSHHIFTNTTCPSTIQPSHHAPFTLYR